MTDEQIHVVADASKREQRVKQTTYLRLTAEVIFASAVFILLKHPFCEKPCIPPVFVNSNRFNLLIVYRDSDSRMARRLFPSIARNRHRFICFIHQNN